MTLGLFGLFYAWLYYLRSLRKEAFPIRNRCTLISLVLVLLALILWPISLIFAPKDFLSAVHYGDVWVNFVIMPICVAAAVISLIGRPRVIIPILIACLGTVLFWAVSFPSD
jgi:hypothetical protein